MFNSRGAQRGGLLGYCWLGFGLVFFVFKVELEVLSYKMTKMYNNKCLALPPAVLYI